MAVSARRSPAAVYAGIVDVLRYPIVALWLLGTAAAIHFLPALSPASTGSMFGAALTTKAPAIEAQITAVHDFAFPVLSQTLVVQHRARGLPSSVQADTVRRAAQLDAHALPGLERIAGAIPITNAMGIFPASRGQGTTAITYLFFRPSVRAGTRARLTRAYVRRYLSGPRSGTVGVTGALAAEHAQGRELSRSLPDVELASILLVVVIVGLAFRSLLAPAITLVTAGIAYVVSRRILEQATLHLGVVVPTELDPVIVVLLLGIMTDYSVFFLSGMRDRLRAGRGTRPGMREASAEVAPLVLTAGFTVAASVAVIQTARLPLFAELGPGLAITVAVGVVVAVSFVPAILGIVGRLAYWPSRPSGSKPASAAEPPGGTPDRPVAVRGTGLAPVPGLRGALARVTVRRPVAALIVVLGAAALAAAALPLRGATIGVNIVSVLPASSGPAAAAAAAEAGFAPGIVAPTEVLLTGSTLLHDRSRLDRLQRLLAAEPGVAGVLGPADNLSSRELGAFLSTRTGAARYVVILDDRPTGPAAIAELTSLQDRMGGLLQKAGLAGARPAYAGDTALSAGIVRASRADLVRVGLLTLAVDLVILMVFLRAVVAPLALVAASALVVAASFGVTTWVFVDLLHRAGFTFYVPFAAEVLLISFGSDYNLFLVGRIWETEQHLPLRRAIAHAGAEASSAINVAGLALGGSFAMLALVNLSSFHQLALTMLAGLFIDTFFVRSFLVPSVLSLLGGVARWPRRPAAIAPVTAG